jgi:hypothetical protein
MYFSSYNFDFVALNPQPIPPGSWAMLNPQPLPPRYLEAGIIVIGG